MLYHYLVDSYPDIKSGYEKFINKFGKESVKFNNGNVYDSISDDWLCLTEDDIYRRVLYPFNIGDFVKIKNEYEDCIFIVLNKPLTDKEIDMSLYPFTDLYDANQYTLIGKDLKSNKLYSSCAIMKDSDEINTDCYYENLYRIEPAQVTDQELIEFRRKILNKEQII